MDLTGQAIAGDNTTELSATTWRHVKFIEQFSGRIVPLAHDERPFASIVWQPLPSGLPDRRHHSKTSSRTSIFRPTSATVALCCVGILPVRRHHSQRNGAVIRTNARSATTASATVWKPACAKACPTQSIHFGPVIEELREQARKRVEELQLPAQCPAGVPLWRCPYWRPILRCIFARISLVDRPSVYILPDEIHSIHGCTWWESPFESVAGGLVAIATLLVVVFLLRS